MRWYVAGIALACIASCAGLILIVYRTTPPSASDTIKSLFFFALFVGLWSLATLIGYGLRRRSRPGGVWAEMAFRTSFLQGFLISFLLMGALLIRKIF